MSLAALDLPQEVFPAGPLPHDWLLPLCAGLVHHGGFGTTAAGLRAGVPALVIPHVVDQFYWGQRIHKLGLGAPAIKHTELKQENLAEALVELVQNETYRANASALSKKIRREDGLSKAVTIIEERYGDITNTT